MHEQCISKNLINEVGILENLAKQEKITSYSLPTNLVFLVTWQILPLRRAYMHARKRFGIAISVVSATLGRRRSTYRHGCCFLFYLALSPTVVGRRRRWLHPREADGVAVHHCRRRPPARRGAPLSDPPPKLDPKIGLPSLCEALPPVLPRRRISAGHVRPSPELRPGIHLQSPKKIQMPNCKGCVFLGLLFSFCQSKIANSWR